MLNHTFLIPYVAILTIIYIVSIPIRRSTRNKWHAFANQHGLLYEPHNFNNDFALHGIYQNRSTQVLCFAPRRNSRGSSSITVRLNDKASGLYFFVSPGASLLPFVTTGIVLSGDPELDQLCEFGGDPEDQVRELLQSAKLRSFLKYAYFIPIFGKLTLEGRLLKIGIPIYPQKPAQLVEYLTRALQFATVVEQELASTPDSSISTNFGE